MTQQLAAALVPEWTLGDRLRKARELTGLDAGQFAEELGIARNTVGNYEKGRVETRQIVLRAWSLRTGVSLQWLETGESPRPAGGPNGGLECAIRDSNPEPADSIFHSNVVVPIGVVLDPREDLEHLVARCLPAVA